jgi:hypothetical protein
VTWRFGQAVAWSEGYQRRAIGGEAGDAVDPCGLKGLGRGHRRQDGDASPRQHRCACPRGAKQEDIMVRTPE